MRIEDVKKNMERKVKFNGAEYFLTGCILRKTKGKFYYQAELLDLTERAVLIVALDKVESG
ncbi:hypothetical protein [Anaerovorax odorimutans]|uniref:hypothetical protein n=1 Tax=Anaerovorax odorimutans TaxID=109327 RepID=UPI0004061AB5|nr:hypothetical protein [Anaerovorax odorimutans]